MKLHITCSTNAVIQTLSGTNSVIFYLTLLIFHRLLHGVPFLALSTKKKFLIINHLFLIFKFYTYNSRSSCKLNIEHLRTLIYKARNIELEVSKTATIRKQKCINKWQPIPITQSK